jgi:hypothetical protein
MHPVLGSHLSLVHALPSSQGRGVKTQPSLRSQYSVVQASSSQQFPAVWTQPVLAWQLSTVQSMPSSQFRGEVVQDPSTGEQESIVHAFPSLQTLATLAQYLLQFFPATESVVQILLSLQLIIDPTFVIVPPTSLIVTGFPAIWTGLLTLTERSAPGIIEAQSIFESTLIMRVLLGPRLETWIEAPPVCKTTVAVAALTQALSAIEAPQLENTDFTANPGVTDKGKVMVCVLTTEEEVVIEMRKLARSPQAKLYPLTTQGKADEYKPPPIEWS